MDVSSSRSGMMHAASRPPGDSCQLSHCPLPPSRPAFAFQEGDPKPLGSKTTSPGPRRTGGAGGLDLPFPSPRGCWFSGGSFQAPGEIPPRSSAVPGPILSRETGPPGCAGVCHLGVYLHSLDPESEDVSQVTPVLVSAQGFKPGPSGPQHPALPVYTYLQVPVPAAGVQG